MGLQAFSGLGVFIFTSLVRRARALAPNPRRAPVGRTVLAEEMGEALGQSRG